MDGADSGIDAYLDAKHEMDEETRAIEREMRAENEAEMRAENEPEMRAEYEAEMRAEYAAEMRGDY